MKQNEEPFEELIIPRREMQLSTASIYRIYSDYKNFQLVEAGSALEALSMIGNKNVYKIKRHDPLGDNVIQLNQAVRPTPAQNQNVIVENVAPEAVVAPVQVASPEPAPEQVAEASQAAAAAETPLSNDDIDKLLNG